MHSGSQCNQKSCIVYYKLILLLNPVHFYKSFLKIFNVYIFLDNQFASTLILY